MLFYKTNPRSINTTKKGPLTRSFFAGEIGPIVELTHYVRNTTLNHYSTPKSSSLDRRQLYPAKSSLTNSAKRRLPAIKIPLIMSKMLAIVRLMLVKLNAAANTKVTTPARLSSVPMAMRKRSNAVSSLLVLIIDLFNCRLFQQLAPTKKGPSLGPFCIRNSPLHHPHPARHATAGGS